MALGTYSKTQYNNGGIPPINADNLNNNENKTSELDTEVAALKSGAVTLTGVKTFQSTPLFPAGLNADTVSGYGIGTMMYPITSLSVLQALPKKGGIFTFYSVTEGPFPNEGVRIIILPYDSNTNGYLAISSSGKIKFSIDASTWIPVWTSGNDGNGGQPPAPKPSANPAGGTNAPGQFLYGTVTAGNQLYFSGTSNQSGTWLILIQTYFNSTGLPDYTLFSLATGGGAWVTVPTGETTNWQAWRIA